MSRRSSWSVLPLRFFGYTIFGAIDYVVYQPVFLCIWSGQVEVAVGIFFDPLYLLAGVLGENLVQGFFPAKDLFGGDRDVCGLAAGTAGRLVHHQAAIGQRESLPLRSGCDENGGHAGCETDAVGDHIALHEVNRVIDRHTVGDAAPWGVHI